MGDAELCEQLLRASPDEFALRLALLCYYFLRSSLFPADRTARQQHSLWVIEHRPGSYIAGTPYCYITSDQREPYESAKRLWLTHTESLNVNAKILGNAAKFFTLNEKDQTERVYQRAKELEPENPAWPEGLGQLYALCNVRLQPSEHSRDATHSSNLSVRSPCSGRPGLRELAHQDFESRF